MKKNVFLLTLSLLSISFISLNAQRNKPYTPDLYRTVNDDSMNQWVDSVFTTLTPEERIGQLFTIITYGNPSNESEIKSLVEKQRVGGIIFLKGNPQDQAKITNSAQLVAKVPLMISIDGEWGLSMRLSNTIQYPRNMMLGAIQNDSLLYYYGQEVARQCRVMGIHVNFAPDMDVNSNPSNPVIGNRSYGEDPKLVARKGIMYSKGLESGKVLSVAKHFPGHGDTSTDSHLALPVINHDRERLDKMEIYPFKQYIEANLSGIMSGHLYIPALDETKQPASLSSKIVTGLLKNKLGFDGLVFTDGLAMKGVSDEKNHCVRALLAGNDILLGPISPAVQLEAVKKAVKDGVISQDVIDAKCRKVLSYKYILGIYKEKPIDVTNLSSQLNTDYGIWLCRKLNEKAITLLKNKEQLVPLKKLDNRSIAAVSVGPAGNNNFQNTLRRYGDVACFSVADNAGLLALKKKLEGYNTLIISVHTDKVNVNNAIESIAQGKQTILSFFVVPYRMTGYTSSIKSSDAIVLAYENTDYAQEFAAQAIFGGIGVDAKIPVSVKGLFDIGDGIETQKVRLGYNSPEEVGLKSEYLAKIDTIANEGINAKAYPGCQILIAKNGVVIYDKAFGSFEYNGKRKVDTDDIYDLASMTKAVATLPAVMKLYDEDKFSLNTPISKFVPALKNTDKDKITIRDALYHESRLVSFLPYYMKAIDETSFTGKLFSVKSTDLHKAQFDKTTWARTDFKFKPDMVSAVPKNGYLQIADDMFVNEAYKDTILLSIAQSKLRSRKSYLYSCLNFMLLKEVVEDASKTDLNTFLQKNFYSRLGAVTATYNPLNRFPKDRIVPTERDDFLRKQLLQGYVHDEGAAFMGGTSGNAGLFADANDIAKLCQMYLNDGEYGDERYLSKKTCRLFTVSKSSLSRRGLGFDRPELQTNKSGPTGRSAPASVYGHTGFTGTCFWIDPDNQLIFIFLSNRIYPKRTSNGLMSLSIRPRIQEAIYAALRGNKYLQPSTDSSDDSE